MRPSSGKKKKKKKDKGPDLTIEGIRTRHNEQLLRVLEQEQEQEERRERILRGIKVGCVCVVKSWGIFLHC